MKRRNFLRNTALTAAAMAFFNKMTLAELLADPAWKVKMLTKNIGVFTEKGGTILFMLGSDGNIVVDAQFPDTAPHCISEIKMQKDQAFGTLINTHHHGDHTAGNISFKGIVTHVLAHENSLKNQKAVAEKSKTEAKQYYPDQTYTDLWSQKIGGEKVSLHYFGRGHTDGDSFVSFDKANIIHAGDLVFNRRHPFVDRSAGANIKEWIKTLNTATEFFKPSTTYVCGHAGEGYDIVIDKADVLLFRDYLQNVLDLTKRAMAANVDKQTFLKNTITIPGSPQWKGDGISRPLEAAWEELHA